MTEEYCHTADDKGARTHLCACGSSLSQFLSMGTGLTWFEEGRPRVLEHIADHPITVRSHEEHKRVMREHKVDWATLGRGRKGSWL